MKLWSDQWGNGEPLPERYAAGRLQSGGGVGFGANLSPPLRWSGMPAGARSLVLLCNDFDAPGLNDDVGRPGRDPATDFSAELSGELSIELRADPVRMDFFHWVLIDLPPDTPGLAEGEWGRGFTARGKPGPATRLGARHGLNDFTTRFARDRNLAGDYHGYDGPFPPANDSLVHHCVFALYALDLQRLPIEGSFTGPQVLHAMAGHVLGSATHSGTYTLNPRLRALQS